MLGIGRTLLLQLFVVISKSSLFKKLRPRFGQNRQNIARRQKI
ncbi:hypothetical protein HMPREF9444_00297 [Succinatimonas hippei YIT 12066]|uniref:Uncharacterized protein n=1 Tax=Succinatimonas hippei (strain DSM 22608 / JCM 16073 / KCTC 15190 / YIT 12066) TaxID=762983 RepID=E8LHY4_SUCHY|nr:hypothetical protein HMPREF9444_00297 [Succinatimonas hippei YIT 12066]